jgi:hypothetical protein
MLVLLVNFYNCLSIIVRRQEQHLPSSILLDMTTTTKTNEPTPSISSLSQRINDATKDVHEKSGNSIQWKLSLILTSKECYCEAISLFWIVYREIERLYQKHKHHHEALQLLEPVVIVFQRALKVEQDIRTLMPSDEQAQELLDRRCSSSSSSCCDGKYHPPALQAYVDHLETIADESPGKYVYDVCGSYNNEKRSRSNLPYSQIQMLAFVPISSFSSLFVVTQPHNHKSNSLRICMP